MIHLLFLTFALTFCFAHESGEMSVNVGPNQGIAAFDQELGFKLSPEAHKQFEIQTQKVQNPNDLQVEKSSIAFTLKEQNLYRVRDGYIRRIDFSVKQKSSKSYRVSSPSLKAGDEIATHGLGFLRMVEISLGSAEHEGEETEENGHVEEKGGHHD